MAMPTPTPPRGSFRMPNSIVQGLTTTTPTGLNRLTAFQMVTLFGLMAHVSAKHPHKEVRLRLRDILEIIRVGKGVDPRRGPDLGRPGTAERRRRRYAARRYSPKHLEQVHDALLALYDQSVVIRQRDGGARPEVKERIVHVLDSFGYCYEVGGHAVDVDDLPPDRVKVNVGTEERPVWRIRRRTHRGGALRTPDRGPLPHQRGAGRRAGQPQGHHRLHRLRRTASSTSSGVHEDPGGDAAARPGAPADRRRLHAASWASCSTTSGGT